MEVQYDLLRRAAPDPMRLCAARQRDALGRNVIVLSPLEIYGCRGAIHVALLGCVEVTQLHTHHAEYDVFEVGGRARRAFERGDP